MVVVIVRYEANIFVHFRRMPFSSSKRRKGYRFQLKCLLWTETLLAITVLLVKSGTEREIISA